MLSYTQHGCIQLETGGTKATFVPLVMTTFMD